MRGREKKGKGKAGPFEQSGIVWVGKGKRKKMEYVVVMEEAEPYIMQGGIEWKKGRGEKKLLLRGERLFDGVVDEILARDELDAVLIRRRSGPRDQWKG
jgi:hypothetical protein